MWQRFQDLNLTHSPLQTQVRQNNDGVALSLTQPRFELYRSFPEIAHSVYLPDNYEPNYKYPTLVYLHDNDSSELDLNHWLPEITDTNYLGLGVRAPFPTATGLPGKYRWQHSRPDASVAVLCETLREFAQDYSVHPERIVLLGEGQGAVVALQTLLFQQSGLFEGLPFISGVICNNLPTTWTRNLPPLFAASNSRILFLDPIKSAAEAILIDGFKEYNYHVTESPNSEQNKAATINQWVMWAISSAVY